MIVLDTHAFLWFANGDSSLPVAWKVMMEVRPGEVLVPSIVFWELALLVEKKRITANDTSPSFWLRLLERSGFQSADLTPEIAVLSRSLQFTHEDPADRFIAATAYVNKVPLATTDERLRQLDWLECLAI